MNEQVINGIIYPMWNQVIAKKQKWIGGTLFDYDMGLCAQTEIIDIELVPNGDDSAMFSVIGKEFTCGFDVQHGGINGYPKNKGALSFSGYGGHNWEILEPPTNRKREVNGVT